MLSSQVGGGSVSLLQGPELEASDWLLREEVNLVSWHRELPPGLGPRLEEWASRYPAHFDEVIVLPHADFSGATLGLPEPTRGWLVRDITELLARLAQVADARRLRVSFGAVRSDQCRKFHVDYVCYRLVTTYLGPGTEWVPDHAVCRAALEHPADCPCDANQAIVRDATAVRYAVAGEVVLMKGALHASRRGAVHRSPPIEGTGRQRVVLIASTHEGS